MNNNNYFNFNLNQEQIKHFELIDQHIDQDFLALFATKNPEAYQGYEYLIYLKEGLSGTREAINVYQQHFAATELQINHTQFYQLLNQMFIYHLQSNKGLSTINNFLFHPQQPHNEVGSSFSHDEIIFDLYAALNQTGLALFDCNYGTLKNYEHMLTHIDTLQAIKNHIIKLYHKFRTHYLDQQPQ